MKHIIKFTLVASFVLLSDLAFSQGVAINSDGSNADGSAMLDIKSTNSGMLIPRMTQAERNSLTSPATSLIIFQTDNTPGYYYNSGTPASPVWERLATGDDGLVDGSGAATRVAFWTASNTLGSNANLYWDNTNSRLGIGTSSPSQNLHIYNTTAGDGGWANGVLVENVNATTGEAAVSFNNNATGSNFWTIGVNQSEHYDISYGTSFTNGNTKMRIQSNGNVGIGTVSPAAQLHTTGTVRFANYPSGANGAIIRSDASGNLAITNFSGSSSDILLGDNTFGTIEDAGGVISTCGTANYVPKMATSTEIACSQIYDNGTNLGIGTTNPLSQLHITEDMQLGTDGVNRNNLLTFWAENGYEANIIMRETPTHGIGIRYNANDNNLYFDRYPNSTTPSPVMTLTRDSEAVGIGTTAPSAQLHTTGTVRFANYPSGVNGAIIRSDASGNLAITNFSGSSSDILLGNNTFGTIEDAGGVISTCGTANYVPKMTTSTEIACSQIYDNGTNVGIGTTSPAEKLVVNGWIGRTAHENGGLCGSYNNVGANSYNSNPIYIIGSNYKPTSTGLNNMYGIGYSHTNASFINNTSGSWGMYVAADGAARIWLAASASGDSYFNAGDVGIGTTSPLLKLDVRGTEVLGSAFTPDTDNDDNILNIVVGTNAVGSTNGITFFENNSGFGMGLGYDGTGSGATNKMAIYSDADAELVTFENGGDVGIGVTAPDDKLDVSGNAQISGYMKVGNPSAPSSVESNAPMTLYSWNNQSGLFGLLGGSSCGSTWAFIVDGLSSFYEWDNAGSRSYAPLYTPWMWVPTSSTGIRVELNFYNSLESGYDGVYIEYSTNGSSWTLLNSWSFEGYNDATVSGSNSSCSAGVSTPAWTNTGDYSPLSNTIALNGNWVRFRIVAMEDVSDSGGVFELYGFTTWVYSTGSVGGSFASGNIYAQNNVYAGSNVLMGDVAEYFDVEGVSLPGYLISLNPNSKDSYKVTSNKNDSNIIGIHSTAPTVTINDPNSGVPVALTGRVPVYVTNENGEIKPGDFLTASSKPGYACKATQPCYIVGQALESLNNEEGQVLCILKQSWYMPESQSNTSSGSFTIPAKKDSITITDSKISESSKIFITMLGDLGERFWISNKSNGSFTISFSGEITNLVEFDYFVENANISNDYHNDLPFESDTYVSQCKPADFESGDWKYDAKKDIYWKPEPRRVHENSSSLELANEYENAPSTPENPKNGYIYQGNKLVETLKISPEEKTQSEGTYYPENDTYK